MRASGIARDRANDDSEHKTGLGHRDGEDPSWADHVGRVRDPRQDAHHHQGGQYALEPVIRFLQSDDRDVREAARPECRETPIVLEIGKAHLLPAKGYAPSQEAPRRLLAWSRRTLLLDRKRERLRNSADVASA